MVYLESEFSYGSLGISEASEGIVVLSEIMIDTDTFNGAFVGFDRDLLSQSQGNGQGKKYQQGFHFQ